MASIHATAIVCVQLIVFVEGQPPSTIGSR